MANTTASCILELRSNLGEGQLWQLKEAPLSGSLFACEPGVRGLPEPTFAG